MARDEAIEHLTSEDVLTIHEVIVESNDATEPGVSSRGDVDYVIEFVREGHFGRVPETIHEKAFQLLRLLVSNHPFVDGNKRTALASTTVFYALNGRAFEYDREVKTILKAFATDSEAVGREGVLTYLRTHVTPLSSEYRDAYAVLLDDSIGFPSEDNGYVDEDGTSN
ncbi:type II toxin-antitoxin system death-on-curing family toxin [Halalkalicoccus tibetensis]|uniref:Type II toxin-antitoxin system death-on-curing family toxin n=1 Tax=Halalkalicoccus tibetensis TaxID=175632 RepID=A0ABD5UZZ1_9EURY